MIIRKLAASAAAMAMLVAPVAAQASAASSLSVAGAVPAARAGASLQGESDLEGLGTGAYIIGAIVIGLAIWGIIELTDDDNSDSP